MNITLLNGMEPILEKQFLKNDPCRKKAYICSPLSGRTNEEVLANVRYARFYMLYAHEQMNLLARAPHAYLPMLLCDRVPAERSPALEFGLRLLAESNLLLVCGTRVSRGMAGEIRHAAKLQMEIQTFDEEVFLQVKKIVTSAGGDKSLVKIDRVHTVLGMPGNL